MPWKPAELCAALARQPPVRLHALGDSRTRRLVEGLVHLAHGSASQLEAYSGAWANCTSRKFRYQNARHCGSAPSFAASLCGGKLLVSYKACWLLEQSCFDSPFEAGLPAGTAAAVPLRPNATTGARCDC